MFNRYTKYPFYPGQVSLPLCVSEVLGQDYGPPRFNPDFLNYMTTVAANIQILFGTANEVVFPTGEAMLGLWGALKCTLKPRDKVLTVGTGVYGDGFADMAEILNCRVEKLSLPYDMTIDADFLQKIDEAIQRFQPALMTAVHCDTPSGTLNPLAELGRIKKDRRVPLFVVDAVSSLGGAPIEQDKWNVDIMLGGSQKCLGCPADTAIMSISPAAWERIADINYQGYEALLPFKDADQDAARYPYTPNWMGIAALRASTQAIMAEGVENVFARHDLVAQACRKGILALNLSLWPRPEAINSPTVTAVRVPEGFSWPEWRNALESKGLVVGGSLGSMNGKVFRLGHMGVQADLENLNGALDVMAQILNSKRA